MQGATSRFILTHTLVCPPYFALFGGSYLMSCYLFVVFAHFLVVIELVDV